ncbi:MAG: hypothetical protein D6708_07705 [Candidatus Dadabacteria bacterium]|nr:MAG: hypothetical protein D6708_07705 [Candidatus Dadabacteria bacterium]
MTDRRWVVGLWALALLGAAGPAGAWGLEGLRAVRIEVAAEQADPVDCEVELLEALRDAGIAPSPDVRERLRLDVVPVEGGWSAGLLVIQPLCLERDPLRCADQPTWIEVIADRAAESPLPLVRGVAERFVAAWSQANPEAP